MKCTGHRFGCQRCRDRNLSCTYSTTSQSRQRKAERLSKAHKTASHNVSPPSGSESFSVTHDSSSEEHSRGSPARQTPRQQGLGGAQNDHHFVSPPLVTDREPQTSSCSAQVSKDCGPTSTARQTPQDLTRSPEFHDLELPDYIESSLPDFDIDELLQADISPPEIESDAYALESHFASSTSPEDGSGSHAGRYSLGRSNTLSGEQMSLHNGAAVRDYKKADLDSGDMDWSSYQRSIRRIEPAGEHETQDPGRRPSSKTSSRDRASTAASSPRPVMASGNSGFSTPLSSIRQVRPSPATRTGSCFNNTPPCRCVGVTLSLLEKIQGHSRSTSLQAAEKALHSLKGSISQCQALASCRSCPSPSRVMAFSVLLVEKMAGVLEDMASMWEEAATDPAAEGGAAAAQPFDADGRACGWAPIHLGQYRIDTAQEWYEIFGCLVLLQVRRLSSFLGGLRRNAAREGLESHRSALGSVALRIQELQEALGGMTSGLDR